jgi:RNA polymerase sigma-70 factor (ECF subfamily)
VSGVLQKAEKQSLDDPHVLLMLRFQAGEQDAFKLLFEAYRGPLLNFIYRYLQDKRIAEELTQEVFIRIYKSAGTYRPEAMFSTWIYRIATNICLNELRTGRYKHEVEFKGPDEHDDGMQYDPVDERTRIKTDETMVSAHQQELVQKALHKLPKKQRLALIMSLYDQLSYRDIGQRLGCSEAAVKSIIHRSKLALRDLLKKEGMVN